MRYETFVYIHTYKVVEMQHKMFHDSILCLCKLVSFPTHTLKIADSLRQVKSASILCRLWCTISSVKMKQGNCLLLLFVTKLNCPTDIVVWWFGTHCHFREKLFAHFFFSYAAQCVVMFLVCTYLWALSERPTTKEKTWKSVCGSKWSHFLLRTRSYFLRLQPLV